VECYIAGIPFYRNQLLADLVFTPVLLVIAQQVLAFKSTEAVKQ
jgi:hypothetical protein